MPYQIITTRLTDALTTVTFNSRLQNSNYELAKSYQNFWGESVRQNIAEQFFSNLTKILPTYPKKKILDFDLDFDIYSLLWTSYANPDTDNWRFDRLTLANMLLF